MIKLEDKYYSLNNYNGEIWKSFVDGYEVSNMGRVKSVERVIKRCDGITKTISGKILRPNVGTNGYLYVQIGREHGTVYIHRLVAKLFCLCDSQDFEVDHINKDKRDNRSSNLRWVSHLENVRHSNLGKHKDNSMEHNPRTKCVVGIAGGRVVEMFDCVKKITLKYGINYSTLRNSLQKGGRVINGILFRYAT